MNTYNSTPTEKSRAFQKRSVRTTQRDRILTLLLEAFRRGQPDVPLPAILALRVSQYGTRIKELRAQGWQIRNHGATVGGQKRTWFCLESDSPSSTTTPRSAPATEHRPEETPTALFQDQTPQAWRDPELGGRS